MDNFEILTVSSVKINSCTNTFHGEDNDMFSDEAIEAENDAIYSNNCDIFSKLLDGSTTENVFHLSEDIELIVGYIAGWVAVFVQKIKM